MQEPIEITVRNQIERGWFASPDDMEGKVDEWSAYRHAVLYERKSPLRAQAQQKVPQQ